MWGIHHHVNTLYALHKHIIYKCHENTLSRNKNKATDEIFIRFGRLFESTQDNSSRLPET